MRPPYWRIEGDSLINPEGEIVARLVPNLSALRRRELIFHVEEEVRRAYHKGRQDAEEEVRAISEPVYEAPEAYR